MVAVATKAKAPVYARVPRDFPGGTILCVASGPSLTQEDVDYCRGKVDAAIAVNTSYQRVPWAYALYAADAHWWNWLFVGLALSLALLPWAWATHHWIGFAARTVPATGVLHPVRTDEGRQDRRFV